MIKKENVLEIYKVEAEKYNKTRDIQWKMNLSIWTILALATHAELDEQMTSDIGLERAAWLLLFVHFVFILAIKLSQLRSLTRMHNMAKYVCSSLVHITWKQIEEMPLKKSLWEKSSDWVWEILTLCVTAILVYCYISI